MTLEELEHLFRFQLTADEDFTPNGVVEYWLFQGQDRLPGKIDSADLTPLITLLEGYQFDGYRDRVPLFVKLES